MSDSKHSPDTERSSRETTSKPFLARRTKILQNHSSPETRPQCTSVWQPKLIGKSPHKKLEKFYMNLYGFSYPGNVCAINAESMRGGSRLPWAWWWNRSVLSWVRSVVDLWCWASAFMDDFGGFERMNEVLSIEDHSNWQRAKLHDSCVLW
jgi:hypothetical protein